MSGCKSEILYEVDEVTGYQLLVNEIEVEISWVRYIVVIHIIFKGNNLFRSVKSLSNYIR